MTLSNDPEIESQEINNENNETSSSQETLKATNEAHFIGGPIATATAIAAVASTTTTTTTTNADIDAITTATSTTATITNKNNSTWSFAVKNKVEKLVGEHLPESLIHDKKIVNAFNKLNKNVKSKLNDKELHPELDWDAKVRLSNDLCDDEKNFIKERKNHIPMIATTGYLRALQDSGLYDCGMYLAGVSGSCWNIALQYSSRISSQENPIEALLEHFRTRLTNHIASPRGLFKLLKHSPDPEKTVELIFGGLIEKKLSGADIGIIDIYGALLAARLLLGDDSQTQFKDFKLSEQKRFLEGGKNPLPIYTAIHHARPWKDFLNKEDASLIENYNQILKNHHNQKDHYRWFEFTPFEIGCDEFEAWIPTWSFGRKFELQKNLERIPEQNFALLIGIFGAAPCAPILAMKNLGEQKQLKFEGHHAVPASNNKNFLYHLHPPPYKLGVANSPVLHLIDSGASNDLPLYPLTHPNRDVDIIIGFDCSSQINKHEYFEEEQKIFTERRGINSVPVDVDSNKYCEIYDYQANGISGDGFTPVFRKDSCKFVYLPFLENSKVDDKFIPCTEKFCNFANFTYTRDQVDLIVRLAKQNWMEVEDKVKSVIIETWKKKPESLQESKKSYDEENTELRLEN
ncbi:2227_t:CDS:2 [Entrophospora sp. SA101]|nr:2227_t:CDS:2 [Entrophospora sp. SA101]